MYSFVVQTTDSLQEKIRDTCQKWKYRGRHHARWGLGNQFYVQREGCRRPVSSIADNGAFLTLTNENGDTSTGQYQGQNGIVAPGWQFVTGTLSQDGSQINWSNGTFWARCNTGGGGHQRLNLTGTWYAQGNRSQSCSIRQRGNNLQLSNQSGDNASGQITGKRQLTTNWNGTNIAGTVTANGNRINWDNGTYWTRIRVYATQN
jgi:hypothetical protein